MKHCPQRYCTRHEVRCAVMAAALGAGIVSWAAFAEPSPKSDDYKTGGRDRVIESYRPSYPIVPDQSTGASQRYQPEYHRYQYKSSRDLSTLNSLESDEAATASKRRKPAMETISSPTASPKSAKSDEDRKKSQSSDQKKETPQPSPTATARASSSPK